MPNTHYVNVTNKRGGSLGFTIAALEPGEMNAN